MVLFQIIPFLTYGAANQVVNLVKLFPEFTHVVVHNPDILDEGLFNVDDVVNELSQYVYIHKLDVFKRDILGFSKSVDILRGFLLRYNPDIIISHTGYCAGIVNLTFVNRPHISIVHGWGIKKGQNFREMDVYFLNNTSRVICVSNAIKQQMINEGVCEDRIQVIYYGHFVKDGSPMQGLKGDKVLLIFTSARLVVEKNIDFLLDTASLLRDDGVLFLIAGDGVERDRIARRIRDEDLPVRLLGFRADVMDIMVSSDIFFLPSKYDALPFSIIEALFHSRPVIATRVGGIPEMIDMGRNGFLVDTPMEASKRIRFFIRNKGAIREFGKASRIIYEDRFSPSRMRMQYIELFRDYISNLDL